jgi:DNA-binding CsgD family transcriptional regulator
MLERAARLPFVDSQLAVRSARRLVDLGDHDGAARMITNVAVNELALSSWVHVLLDRHSAAEVRSWLSAQPAPSCPHAQVVRSLAEATLAADPATAVQLVCSAVAVASEQRMVGVVADAPAAMWGRDEIRRLDLPLLNDARRRLSEGVRLTDGLRFSEREIELLRLMARAASAAEVAERLYLSVNTVKWHKANIYRKLGVGGSREAIDRARALGVISSDVPTVG